MKREDYKKAKNIIAVLDRIDRVLSTTTIIHEGRTTVEHSFKPDIEDIDISLLARHDVEAGFLKLLYEKKIELEKKLEEL